jgi:hypothetical protein
MKYLSASIVIVFAGCALALAQEQTTGRIYIGTAEGAPAWTSEITNRTTSLDQLAANADWVKSIEAAFAEKRAADKDQSLKTDEARAFYQADPAFRTVRPEAGGAQAPRGRGILIDYNAATLTGLISAEDGKRWPFYRGDWADFINEPIRGLWVDFIPENETGFALFVYSLGPFIPTHLQLEKAR